MIEKTVQKEILTGKEVAKLLGLHPRTITRMRKKGILTAYDFYGRKYYKYSEIALQIEAGKEENQNKQAA